MERLKEYRGKRDFNRTLEPAGAQNHVQSADTPAEPGGSFVIQKHDASRLHYDLRLELNGVYKSWAVPKGPSLKPGEKRLAVEVEDHPLEYGTFEGTIPAEEYGGGTVMLWDCGHWTPFEKKGKEAVTADRIDFVLAGEKLRGAWSLIRTSGRPSSGKTKKSKQNQWLLIKRSDKNGEHSEVHDLSVKTGRSMEQIANDEPAPQQDPEEQSSAPDPSKLPGASKKALPKKPEPALATLRKKAPDGPDWIHEIKFDGYRIMAHLDKGSVTLFSRNGKNWTRKFPQLASSLESFNCDQALLDGEVVAYKKDGTTNFADLQEALSSGSTRNLSYQLFDICYLDGYDLSKTPLTARKSALHGLMLASGIDDSGLIRYTDHVHGQGPEFAEHAGHLGLEGIICKRADGPYRSGRNREWLKVKCSGRDEFLICGYTEPKGSRKGFGALLLGAWHNKTLRYTGKVGTGFTRKTLTDLTAKLEKLSVKKSPFKDPPGEDKVHWVKPSLIAEIEFSNWTRDGVLRHPAFQGLRDDKSAKDVKLPAAALGEAEQPAEPQDNEHATKTKTKSKPNSAPAKATNKRPQIAGVTLSSPDKVLYPEQGITKLELAQYYADIESWILPHLQHRPLSLVRCPGGHTKQCFFQKHPGSTVSKKVPRIMIEDSSGESPYLYVESLSDIIALVQIGALEFHTWGSTIDDIEHPDTLVFDLDPSPEVPLSQVFEIARDLRGRLEELGLQSFPRTTGGKGLHLVVPIVPNYNWDEIKAFCRGVAKAHVRDDAKRVTATMSKAKRKGRIFLDYLRNGRGATAVASFSARARDGAPVAVPVRWDEVNSSLSPDQYSVKNLRRRLIALRQDPWHDYGDARTKLTAKAMRSMEDKK
ncbi:DNA ligase D [Aliidiomarina sedimenti]|uniref:DNA ligase (ATP) n=1 Tax=Aliidiomarina sedimenti TaxID=1933879 RepID=A0ABY0BZ11_9GAMM|nr:DNA ligase D [Aliidiomarina sedimenti]RUO29994.1 DNA ligase D [Aliidiomarina sedimenti]